MVLSILSEYGNMKTDKIRLRDTAITQGELPEWASFLIKLGFRIPSLARNENKYCVVVLLPTRTCASAIAALGILLASASRGITALTYDEFLKLPIGSKIFSFSTLKGKRKMKEWRVWKGDDPCVRKLRSGGATLFIYKEWAEGEVFFSESAAKPRKLTALKNVASFYADLTNDTESLWPYVSRCECAIVTNRTKWKRDIANLLVEAKSSERHEKILELDQTLMVGGEVSEGHARVLLSSYGDEQPELAEMVPVILDGPDALISYQSFSSNCVLCLLEKSEYSESVEQEIMELLDQRNDAVTQRMEIPMTEPPDTIEILTIAFDAAD